MTASKDNQSLRIAYFTFSYAPFMTGVAVGSHTRIRRLLERGHEVFLIHPEVNEHFPSEFLNRQMPGLEELSEFSGFTSATYPTLPHPFQKSHPEPRSWKHWSDTQLLEQFQPDITLVSGAAAMKGMTSLGLGGYGKPVGVEYGKRAGVPTVVLFETDMISYAELRFGRAAVRLTRPILRPLLTRFSNSYTTTFFPSKVQQQRYRNLGIPNSEHVAFHGTDSDVYCQENIAYDPLSDDKRPMALYVARLTPEKNLPTLFRAFDIVHRKVPDAHLVVVGGGEELENVRRLARPFGNSVTVWGESFGNELKGLYARGDVFANPSITENFCTTNMEALASGTPIVAANAGGNSEQVTDGINGFLSPPNDHQDMAEKVVRILQDKTLRDNLSHGARKTGMELDTWHAAGRLESAMYRLIDEANRKTPRRAAASQEIPSRRVTNPVATSSRR